jgi:DNA-binding FadR family transcriptional regulator
VAQIEQRARQLEPGAYIGTKNDLRRELGVAMGTFNEALRVLVSRGIVTVRPGPGGGLFVADQASTLVRLGNNMLALGADDSSVHDAMRVRDALDRIVNEDAAMHYRAADLRSLRAIVKKMERPGLTPRQFVELTWRLHRRLADISPNVVLRGLYTGLLDILESQTSSITADPNSEAWVEERAHLHGLIVEAIAARDFEAIADLTNRHTLVPPEREPAG